MKSDITPSNKSFGIVFSVIFLIIGLYPLSNSQSYIIWPLIVSVFLMFFAFIMPNVLKIPNKLWNSFGVFLGSIIAPIVMMFVYFFTVLPTGVIMRLLGKDILRQKLNKNIKSYWIERKTPAGPMKNQF